MNWLGVFFIYSLGIPFMVNVATLNLPLYRIVLLIAFVPSVLAILTSRKIRFGVIELLLIVHFIFVVMSLSVNHGVANIIEPSGSYFVECVAAFLLGKAACQDKEQFLRIFRHVVYMLCLLLPFVMIQSFTGQNVLLDFARSLFPIVAATIQDQRLGLFRANVTFPHSILFGIFASFALSLVFLSYRKLKYLSVPVIGLSTFFSLSTGALLVFVVQTIFLFWNRVLRRFPNRWWILFGAFLFTYVSIDVLSNRTPFHVFVDYLTLNSGSAYNRILIWHYGTAEVARHPFFGIAFNEWNNPEWMSDSMDNFWLLIAVRYGLPAFVFLFAAFVVLFWKACRRSFPDDPHLSNIRLGWCLSLLAFAIAGSTVHFFGSVFPLFLFLWGAGAWFYDRPLRKPQRVTPAVVSPSVSEAGLQTVQARAGSD